ncbi:MAG: response regulator transcription factor [Alphaproteobacteria bacterium]|nr:response regulator transcription factor [Alphaproteobacteria bacterium]
MARILVIEDEDRQALLLQRGLGAEGHTVGVAPDGVLGLARAQRERWDLLVVDRMLPGLSGVDLCRAYRATGGSAPLLFLTARDTTADVVEGLDAGADDYLVKPFAFDELCARVRTLLRRSPGPTGARLATGPLVLDPAEHRAWCDGVELELTAKELELLHLLMKRSGSIVTRDALAGRLWDLETEPASNALEVHVSSLRRKLGDHGTLVRTVRGIGYTLREAPR